ncbi:MAG: type II toxin-antitoxin system ParD family antitoxin [Acidobacteria bacterium]|nr:type II toxin-antitoxin system ParD family antitoxin [Acidobacteriota bacterium]
MNVSLTPELEEFIEQEVRAGVYPSASEVIRAGLRLLKDEKQAKPRFVVTSSEELETKLLAGIRQLERGEGLPGELAAKQLRERAQARRQRNG